TNIRQHIILTSRFDRWPSTPARAPFNAHFHRTQCRTCSTPIKDRHREPHHASAVRVYPLLPTPEPPRAHRRAVPPTPGRDAVGEAGDGADGGAVGARQPTVARTGHLRRP